MKLVMLHHTPRRIAITITSLVVVLVGMGILAASPASAATCGGVDTSIISGAACDGADVKSTDSADSPVISVLVFVMQILTGAVGVAAVGTLIYAGILYSAAGGESGQVQKAKTIIKDTVIGIVCYAGMILILNFVIPGGVFGQQSVTGGGTASTPGGSDGNDPIQTSNDPQFSIVSMPDTQFEINREAKYNETKVLNNMKWIAANKDEENIQVVVGPGDLTNAGRQSDPDVKDMFKSISKDYAVLDAAKVPYSITNGNHDSDATCSDAGSSYGARECPGQSKNEFTDNLHKTAMFDKTFTPSRAGLKGLTLFESGRVVNSYRVFRVRNTNWLILTLEFYPRDAVFKWAQKVVASHPTYNVVVVTHGYMGDGTNVIGNGIYNYCAKDGDCTKPTTIQKELLLKYPNVKMLFSGHVTTWSTRTDTSASRGKVVQFKTTVHACVGGIKCTNPMRIATIDLENNTLESKFCQTATTNSLSDCETKTTTGMKYVTSGSSGSAPSPSSSTTFDNIVNFRDAATLNTTILKPGLLYRSGNLNEATTSDKSKMAALLKGGTLIDLRQPTDSAFKKDPSLSGVTNLAIPIKGEGSASGYVKTFVNDATARAQFGKAIIAIANNTGPSLVHCKHGKDRTGWTVAMIMYIVGDGKFTASKLDAMVEAEYLKSNDYKAGSVNKAWLRAALTEARIKYRSIMGYIKNGLGVSDDTITLLKNRLGV